MAHYITINNTQTPLMNNKLILVHSGNIFPTYLNDCIDIALKQEVEIHVLLSSKLHKNILRDIRLEKIEDYVDEKYLNYSNRSFDNEFRDGFWTRTSSRFFVLSNYAKAKKIESFFHIENDVALIRELSRVQKMLDNSDQDLAIIMDAINRCIPSFMWARNHFVLDDLSNYIFKNNHLHDMSSLASYFHKNREKVLNLPIYPLHNQGPIDFGNKFEEFGCIFDGAAIGQYLYGIDCIEDPDKDTRGFINETCIFNASQFNYKWEQGSLFASHNNKDIPIANLHMHCKNLKQLLYKER